MSDVSMENSATIAIALRGDFGTPASQRIARYTSGVDATTYPPIIIITICMVNGTSDQKLFPPATASFDGLSPSSRPVTNTTTMPINANTSGSGNQRSLQLARASPKPTKIPSLSLSPFFSKRFCDAEVILLPESWVLRKVWSERRSRPWSRANTTVVPIIGIQDMGINERNEVLPDRKVYDKLRNHRQLLCRYIFVIDYLKVFRDKQHVAHGNIVPILCTLQHVAKLALGIARH